MRRLPLDEFFNFMELVKIDEEEQAGKNTLGGFVMAKIGAVYSEGRHFEWKGCNSKLWIWTDGELTKSFCRA